MESKTQNRITGRAFVLGVIFSAVFAGVTVYFAERRGLFMTATQIPVLPYVLLLVTVLLINPFCRLVRFVREFSIAEIMIIFMMGLVSSGISTFGLTAQLVPVIGSLFNPSWNNEQTQWNRYVVPFLNEDYFLAENGIRRAARRYADLAEAFDNTAAALAEAEQRRGARSAADETADERAGAAKGEPPAPTHGLTGRSDFPDDPETAVRYYRGELESLSKRLETARENLDRLESKAFEKVERFRRGLPAELRAYPGIVKMPQEPLGVYLSRFRRMVAGRRTAGTLKKLKALASDDPEDVASLRKILSEIVRGLEAMSDSETIVAEIRERRAREDALSESLIANHEALRDLHRRRRVADRGDMRRLEREIADRRRRSRKMERDLAKIRQARQFLEQQVGFLERGKVLVARARDLDRNLRDGVPVEHVREQCDLLLAGLPSLDGTLRRYLLGDVPWSEWCRPLLLWGALISLTYLVFMAFNVLIFRQWAYNEKLIYPLAELPMTLAGVDREGRRMPPLFRSGLFWAGVGMAAAFLGYNLLVSTQLIPGLTGLDFENKWDAYIDNTAFRGLLNGKFSRSHIFFTMIGLSFLIPAKVSFSLWFFSVLSMLQVLIMVWAGYGQNEASFPCEWWYTFNFRTAQGAGALLVFASAVLFKCRGFLLCAFRPAALKGLDHDEQRELRFSSFCFLFGSMGVVLMLWLSMGASLVYSLVAYFVILILTIGLIRAVAEGGILGFQAWTSPFHFIRTFFGMDKTWTRPELFAPLMVYYSVLFLDIKTFIAPAMANSLKIRDSLRMRRGRFHLAILAGILAAALVAVLMSIMMAYSQGADLMSGWFYTSFPRTLFNRMAGMSANPPEASVSQTMWVVTGAGAMGLLLFLRQSFFWLPHPIGMIMLVNPIMGAYWFSILLGWLCKSLVTKYGNKTAYASAKNFFIGLIVGELLLVVVGMFVSYALGINVPLGLNRN